MHPFFSRESQPSARASRTITRTAQSADDDPVRRSLTSGFGAVMEQERDLQASTLGCVGAETGPRSTDVDRILRHQETQLGANIALLGQRYEMLPSPGRFRALQGKARPPARRVAGAADDDDPLRALIAQHVGLLGNIDVLIAQRPDGQRGELILNEVARNHEEMAWMLTALIKEDESVRDRLPSPVIAAAAPAPTPGTTEGNWENEGGAARTATPAPDASARRPRA